MPSEVEVEFESDSSTVVYDHEPFETFKARVLGLCQTVLISADDKISIELMYGGGFNRNIGVHVPCSEHTAISQYVLRIPRFEAAQLDRNLAPLQLLRQQSKIQIPEVIAFDTTRHNVLESPYMIQTRIPGSSLFLEYPDMPHEMKCSIAKELIAFSGITDDSTVSYIGDRYDRAIREWTSGKDSVQYHETRNA
ncbi:hypothetical protein BDV12DRAFT_172294 [Aspergillus spectabilis]